MDEAGGNTYTDAYGLNNGTGNPSPTATTGKVSGAQQFNGTTTKIEVPASPTFDFASNGDFSFEFWYKQPTAPSTAGVVIARSISSTVRWDIAIMNGTGNVRLWIQGGSTPSIIYGGSVTDGNWHHIVATRNGTSGMSKIYVDGILKGQTTATFTENFSSPTANVQIGSWTGSSFILQGSLDELAVHNVELLPAEIMQHYTNGLIGLGYYDMAAPAVAATESKSAEIATSTFDTPQMELNDLKVYPNPFSDRLRFEFSAPESVNARIDLYDMTGRMVKTIFEQAIEGGVNYNAEFKPEATVSGMYIYRMTMGEKVYNGKVVFRK